MLRVEHRLVGTGFGLGGQYSSCAAGEWNAAGSRSVPDTLLGPEGSGECVPFLHGLARPGVSSRSNRRLVVQLGRRRDRRDAARMLRTTQWTRASYIFVAQVFKGTRWMPWHQEPKKDVGICDKPRGVDNQTVIRGFPNGETRLEASPVTPT